MEFQLLLSVQLVGSYDMLQQDPVCLPINLPLLPDPILEVLIPRLDLEQIPKMSQGYTGEQGVQLQFHAIHKFGKGARSHPWASSSLWQTSSQSWVGVRVMGNGGDLLLRGFNGSPQFP